MKTIVLSLFAVALLTLTVGCGATSQVVRSQGPSGPATYGGEYCPEDCNPYCADGCIDCRYNIPRDLSYPPGAMGGFGAMPAVVQYPYYTCKGPDCFFHQ